MNTSNTLLVISTNTLVLDDQAGANTLVLVDIPVTTYNWIDYAMPKLRTKYSGTLGTAASLNDYLKAWQATNTLTGNLDDERTFMIDALDAIPVSHPARNAMAVSDLRLLYWANVTL